MENELLPEEMDKAIATIESNLQEHLKGDKKRQYTRFTISALSSIPWIGGFIAASAALNSEKDQSKINEFQKQWLEEHAIRIQDLGNTLNSIMDRIESFGDDVKDRLESPEYLILVRKGFRSWDQADTDEKRDLLRKLLSNACGTMLCPDDLVRLFIDWINTYHEAHFRMIKEVYEKPGISRGEIWDKTAGPRPREDSAEADVYKLLIRDLTIGGVIRQHQKVDAYGNPLKKTTRTSSNSKLKKSAFDDNDPYELTELGKQFVHYAMTELTTRIENSQPVN
ncbi:MAG: hypothetical protein V5783_10375 [Pontiella sp.]